MTDKEIFANEILCIKRRASGRCNGGTDCNTCDLLMDDTEIIEAYQRAMKNNDLINRLQKENTDLFFKLQGVMHSVDKWLDGDELKQDEVNRAVTMREKTLQIVEAKQAEIKRLKKEQQQFADIGKMYSEVRAEAVNEFAERLKATDMSDIVGEQYINGEMYGYFHSNGFEIKVDNLVKKMTEVSE